MFISELPPKVRRVFWLDSASAVVVGILSGATAPFLGIIARREFNAGALAIALLTAAPLAGFLLTSFWVKRAETGGKVRQVVWLNFIARAVLLFIAFSHTAFSFITILCISAIIPALSYPAYVALLKAIYPENWRGRITSLVKLLSALVAMGVAAGVGVLLEHWSFRWIFPAAAGISLVGLLFYRLIPEPEKSKAELAEPASPSSLKSIFLLLRQDSFFARFSLAFFIFSLGVRLIGPVAVLFQVDELKITTQWAGALATLNTLVAAVSYYFWGKIIDRRGALVCLSAAMFGFFLVTAGYGLVPSLPWLIPLTLVGGFAGAAHEMGMVNALLIFGKASLVPRYTGVHFTLLGLVGLIAPLLGGLLVGIMPLRTIFFLAGSLTLAGFLLMRPVQQKAGK